MSLKIFHTSDLHLGMKFAGYPEVQAELSEARFKTFENLVSLANREKCDLFIIAGDLFDRVSIAKKDIIRTSKILQEFQGHLVAILPGNHDFISSDSTDLWLYFKENIHDNVVVLNEKKVYPLQHYDLDAHLYAAPCNSKQSGENAIAWTKESKKDGSVAHHIGVAHGSLEGFSPDFDQRYYPMSVSELQKCGLDIWLLGHTHVQYPEKPGTEDRIFYPGTPEPDGFDCQHEGKAWIIEVDDDKKIHPASLSTGTYKFLHEELEVDSLSDLKMLRKRYASEDHRKVLLKLRLKGRLPRDEYESLCEIRKPLEQQLFHLILNDDEVTEEITIDTINQEFTEGSFPHMLLTALAHDSEALQIAYDLIKEVGR
ncbi:MAG: DNA repair exonuclease [Nitrospirae bacterium]|jgi:DNA repair protein SbcD/Mre11|nr:DNA repair exonuclease [Nitrospirota bacterium]